MLSNVFDWQKETRALLAVSDKNHILNGYQKQAETFNSRICEELNEADGTIPGRFEDIHLTVVSVLWDRSAGPARTR